MYSDSENGAAAATSKPCYFLLRHRTERISVIRAYGNSRAGQGCDESDAPSGLCGWES
jgi:hypothetical protein